MELFDGRLLASPGGKAATVVAALTVLMALVGRWRRRSREPGLRFHDLSLLSQEGDDGGDWRDRVILRRSGSVPNGPVSALALLAPGSLLRFNANTIALSLRGIEALKAELCGPRPDVGHGPRDGRSATPDPDSPDAMIARHISRRLGELSHGEKSWAPPPAPLPPREPPRPRFGRKAF